MLEETKMIEVLTAIYKNEVKAINHYNLGMQKTAYLQEYVYPYIFDSLNVTDSAFYQSYHYYEQTPVAMNEMMTKVIQQLESLPIDSVKIEDGGKSLEDTYKEINELERQRKNNARSRFEDRK